MITTNTPFSDWGNILFNTTIATAIADRLVENSEIFLLGGDSLRKANKNPESAGRVVRPAPIKRRAVRYPARRSPPGNPSTALPMGAGASASRFCRSLLHVQLQRQSSVPALADGIPSCAVFLMQDLDTQRVYRLYDFTKAQLIPPRLAYCIAGKVNSADKLYLVIESVRPDTKHAAVLHCSCSC